MPSKTKSRLYLFYACVAALLGYAAGKIAENGDFIGYTNAGDLVLKQGDIYSDMFNTWPPVFSVIAVPLSILNQLSFIGVRILWMAVLFIAFFYCIKSMLRLLEESRVSNKETFSYLKSPAYLMGLILCMRAMMDNLMYMQINVLMLSAICMVLQQNTMKGQYTAAGVLGFTIGSKVYNVFILPVYVLFRKWKALFYIVIGIALTLLLSITVFGFELFALYFQKWFSNTAMAIHTIEHRNQSLLAALMRLFTAENAVINDFGYITDLTIPTIKKMYYALLLVFVVIYLASFRKALLHASEKFFTHTIILCTAFIPVLTPLAWKANYIYALPAYFFMVHFWNKGAMQAQVKILFSIACVMLSLSNEAFIGREAMYFLEKCNVLVLGEMLLTFSAFLQMVKLKTQYEPEAQAIHSTTVAP